MVEDAVTGVEAAAAGGFGCAAMGDAKDDARASWHLNRLSDLCIVWSKLEARSFIASGTSVCKQILKNGHAAGDWQVSPTHGRL